MTHDARQAIRLARDQHARQQLIEPHDFRNISLCVGCQAEYENVTAGCIQCTDRARARAKRREVRLLGATAKGSLVNRRAHVRGVARMLDKANA